MLFRTFEIENTVNEMTLNSDKDNSKTEEDNADYTYTSVLSTKIGTKAILLQVIPALNILSILIVSTGIFNSNTSANINTNTHTSYMLALVGNPLLVFDEYLSKKLPPVFIYKWTELKEKAIKKIEDETTSDKKEIVENYNWKIYLQALNVFLDARAISFIVNFSKILIASTIAFASSNNLVLYSMVMIFVILTLPFILVQSFQVVLLIGDRLKISDDDFIKLWNFFGLGFLKSCIIKLISLWNDRCNITWISSDKSAVYDSSGGNGVELNNITAPQTTNPMRNSITIV